MSEPDSPLRRRLLKDLFGYAVGSYLGMASQPFGLFLRAGARPTPTEDLAQQRRLELLRTRLAERMGVSPYKIDESRLGEFAANLRRAIDQQEAIRISREELAGLVAAYAGAKIHQEKGVYLSDLQFSGEVKGSTFDIVARLAYGMLCVSLKSSSVSEDDVSVFTRFCVAPNVEEGWLVSPSLEPKVTRGAPVSLWENRYLFPLVRLTNYEAVFDELLAPVVDSFKSKVQIDGQTLVLQLLRTTVPEKSRVNPSPPAD